MKTKNATPTCETLEGIIRSACDQVRKLMAEDGDPSMRRACAALKEEAQGIILRAGEFSALYITGERHRVHERRAARALVALAAPLAPRTSLRKINMVCAAVFLAEYIGRQRKANETIANTPANLAKLHALAVNGTPMFYIWLDAVDDAATTSVYLTEDAARADIARLEADDKEAGIYEPDAYSIINAAPYFA